MDNFPPKTVFGNTTNRNIFDNGNSKKEQKPVNYPLFFSKRFLVLVLAFCGYFVAAVIKVVINIAIIEMTSNKTSITGHETNIAPALYSWDSKTKALVLGTHAYGLLFSPFGGYLATKFGGATVYGVASIVMSVFTILNPISLDFSFEAYLVCRIVCGMMDGFGYASSAEVFSRWIPAKERSTFMSIIFSGMYVGIAVAYPFGGYISYFWNWRMIFYVIGGIALFWSILWLIVVKNDPSLDTCISRKESQFIARCTDTTPRKQIKHPYKQLATSAPVWALCVGKFTFGWGFATIVVCLPLYIKDTLNKQIDEIGVISSIPNFVCIFMTPLVGAIMDYIQNNSSLKPSQIHKIMMTFGYTLASILFAVAACTSDFNVIMGCFILIKVFLSFNFLILQLVCLYIAPKQSGLLLGISAFWYILSNIIIPFVIGFVVVDKTIQEWNSIFFMGTGVMILGAVAYLICGSSELQPWARSHSSHSFK